ncbi:MAG: M90 family metallopeptidase [Reichenbachiella sp.]|uniref:M90 family metallopeptidase n=1 Tax=Reichenbachiella sp. TaxID=2184521 RepID=UPI00326743C8
MQSFTGKLFLGIGAVLLFLFAASGINEPSELILILVVIALTIWVTAKKKKSQKESISFQTAWRGLLSEKVDFYRSLNRSDKEDFEQRVISFFNEIKITGVDFEIDDECRLLVAASSIIPFWKLPVWNFGELREVLVYSNRFDENFQVGTDHHVLGMVGTGGHMSHVMLLSKPSLYRGFENKTNKMHVGFHEFAHLLDMSDGEVDGIPEVLLPGELINPWTKLVHREIKKIKQNKSDINSYGATSEAEFFAVISEYYHKRPKLLARKHPDLYKILKLVYNPNIASA